MRIDVRYSAANGETIPPAEELPKRGETLPLLTEDGFEQDAKVVSVVRTSRGCILTLKAKAGRHLPGLTPVLPPLDDLAAFLKDPGLGASSGRGVDD